jgi:hypothetical protein
MSWQEPEPGSPRRVRWQELLENQVIRVSGAPGRNRGRFLVHFAGGISLAVTSALFSSWVHVQNVNVRYEVSQKLRVQRELIQARDELEIERQMLRSPRRIMGLAEGELRLHLPANEERVVVK